MNEPIHPVRAASAVRRMRGRKAKDAPAPDAAQATAEPPRAAAVRAPPQDAAHAISAQILGQAAADSADGSAKTADKAASAYREVEWSGGADRRHRRGRLAKTQI